MLKNLKIATRTGILITLVLIIGFWGLWKSIDHQTSTITEQSITNQMTDAVKSRATIIDDYVKSAEDYLVAFGQAEEVKNLLKEVMETACKMSVPFTVEVESGKTWYETK